MQGSWSEWATVVAALLTALAAIGAGFIVPRSNAQRAAETFRALRETESVSGDMTPVSRAAKFVVAYQAARDCATALESHRITWALGGMGVAYMGMGIGLFTQAASQIGSNLTGAVFIAIGFVGMLCALATGARVSAACRRIIARILPESTGLDPALAARLRSRRRTVKRRDDEAEEKIARRSFEMRQRRILQFEKLLRSNPDHPTPQSLGAPGSAEPLNER